MKYYSTQRKSDLVTFRQALLQGLAPDKGLYFPTEIPIFDKGFLEGLSRRSLVEIGFQVGKKFIGEELKESELIDVLEALFQFDIPLVTVNQNFSTLELFHGPTCSFKDVGAGFMARVIGCFNKQENEPVTVLVATSGDTGSAVAHGFLGVEGVRVVILYPEGKISHIQEQQLTTLGQNIIAVEVQGTFDDCQALVKQAFVDPNLTKHKRLTSANSINIGRLIPQSFYYTYALAQLQESFSQVVVSVPSGNFGNLTAGLIAKRMGLPVTGFIAATNSNNVVPNYLREGFFHPKPSVSTISNAMDVGNPSNFVRMLELYDHSVDEMRKDIKGYAFTDSQTLETIEKIYASDSYLMDPHGAVGYLGLSAEQVDHDTAQIFLETAHPAKFGEVLEENLGIKPEIPSQLQECMKREKKSVLLSNDYKVFSSFLLGVD